MHRLLILACSLLAVGCVDDTIDSLTAERIQISEKPPPEGRVGVPYAFRITAEVKNSSADKEFDYRFSLLDGTLPPGTSFETNRETGNDFAEIVGTPATPGSYTFAVNVKSVDLEIERDQGGLQNADSEGNSSIKASDEGMYTIVING